jgi:hypothetical protein
MLNSAGAACLVVKRLSDLKPVRYRDKSAARENSERAALDRLGNRSNPAPSAKLRISGKGGHVDTILREEFECNNRRTFPSRRASADRNDQDVGSLSDPRMPSSGGTWVYEFARQDREGNATLLMIN